MVLYDSSVLIDYLAGGSTAVQYVEDHLDERAVVPPLVLFEVYQGEVFKSGTADFEAVDDALAWVTVVETDREVALTAAVVQNELHNDGTALAPRDAFIAGTAVALDETLAVSDDDFDVPALADIVDIELL